MTILTGRKMLNMLRENESFLSLASTKRKRSRTGYDESARAVVWCSKVCPLKTYTCMQAFDTSLFRQWSRVIRGGPPWKSLE
jgi:hypothetical protein